MVHSIRFGAVVALALCPAASAFVPLQNARVATLSGAPAITVPRTIPSFQKEWRPLMTTAVAEDSESKGDGLPPGDATVPQLVFNLVKSIVGAGVLSLPAGIAAWGNAPSAAIPAIALIAVIGGLSGYGFALIGRTCAYTGTKSFRDAWSASVSESTSWIPATAVTCKTCIAVLAYSMILADTFVSLFSTVGITLAKAPCLIGLTSTVLLPLCLMKNLSSLAPFSLVGSLGMIYTAAAMLIRYCGKAYCKTGAFGMDCAPALRPSFGTVGASGIMSPSAAILVGMLSTAYMAHFNAPKFYTELKERTLKNYYKVVGTSFAFSIGIFAAIAALGFLTFGRSASGLILNNYSSKDTLMGLSRLAVAVSLVFSFPLAFVGARDGFIDLLKLKGTPKTQNTLTLALLSVITTAALIIPDVSFVMAFFGATLGNALIYVFPYIMFRGAIKRNPDATKSQKREVKFAMGSAGLGIGMGLLGAKMALGTL